MYERRVHIRFPVGMEGNYQPAGKLAAPNLGMTRDISLGGSRFATSERLEPGQKFQVTLKLPQEGRVTLTGLVVWSRESRDADQGGYEAGLCWTNVDPQTQVRLNNFLTDYTRVDSLVVFSRPPSKQRVSLIRVVLLALVIFSIRVIWAHLWVNQLELTSERNYLRSVLSLYQKQ